MNHYQVVAEGSYLTPPKNGDTIRIRLSDKTFRKITPSDFSIFDENDSNVVLGEVVTVDDRTVKVIWNGNPSTAYAQDRPFRFRVFFQAEALHEVSPADTIVTVVVE